MFRKLMLKLAKKLVIRLLEKKLLPQLKKEINGGAIDSALDRKLEEVVKKFVAKDLK